MTALARSTDTVRHLLQQAEKHDEAADALAGAAQRFTREGYGPGASLSVKGCHAHRVWALMARTRAHALASHESDQH